MYSNLSAAKPSNHLAQGDQEITETKQTQSKEA